MDTLKGEAAKVAAKLPKSSLHLSLWTLDPLDVHRILWVFPTMISNFSSCASVCKNICESWDLDMLDMSTCVLRV